MGCGDTCPFFPGKRYEDWELDDPAGQGIEAVRPIRDEIRARIEQLVEELLEPTNEDVHVPSVLFVCVKNAGKSQMAAALMRQIAGGSVDVHSAGTAPGTALNALSAASVAEVGASMDGEHPKPIDPELLRAVDRVVVIGDEAVVEPVPGMAGTIETWKIDEPTERGIEGEERMHLVRDELAERVRRLAADLAVSPAV